jgi:hypothetical protein
MSLLGDAKKRFSEPTKENSATTAALLEQSSESSRISVGRSENPTYSELSDETKSRLRNVVRKLTAACLDFYRDDQAILECMSEEALEFAVCEYLAKSDWYQRGLIEDPKPNEPTRLKGGAK